MNLFDVYPLLDFEPVQGKGCYLFDGDGNRYLDLYGGHAVISVGHSHPYYLQSLYEQAGQLSFYSNAVKNSLQVQLAKKLGTLSGYQDYQLFLCNSGTEANENALKLASFYNHRRHLVAFDNAFHGRTAASLVVTDNATIKAALNESDHVTFLPLNEIEKVAELTEKQEICAVIIEGIQGVGGIYIPKREFLQKLVELCHQNDIMLILDEVQSGYGRSGHFFAHQLAGIQPDLITVAKGMGNGFPITPVEAMRTSVGSQPKARAVSPVIANAAVIPSSPLHTFAFPLLTIIALAVPFFTFSRLTSTGAPLIRFMVNNPAQDARTSETITARSGLPAVFIPHSAVPKLNPLGAVTPPLIFLIRNLHQKRAFLIFLTA